MMYLSLLEESVEKISLLYRPKLIPLREKLMEKMSDAPKGTVFYYDMSQIEGINGSGADEIIVKPIKHFINTYKSEDKFLVLENLSEDNDHVYNIELTLKVEDVTVIGKMNDQIYIIGSLSDSLREILKFAIEHKKVTARDVADKLDKKLNLASTYLNKLNELRLLKRYESQLEEGGRQFIYSNLLS